MATKKDVLAALNAKQGSMEDESNDNAWILYLVAPVGRLWSDYGSHKKAIFSEATDDKSAFWDSVLKEIEDLGLAIPCDVHSCVEWDLIEGHCGYWHSMTHDSH